MRTVKNQQVLVLERHMASPGADLGNHSKSHHRQADVANSQLKMIPCQEPNLQNSIELKGARLSHSLNTRAAVSKISVP